jgi:hypothetical protein
VLACGALASLPQTVALGRPVGPDSRELTLGAALFRVLVDDNPASDNIAGAGNISRTSEKMRTPASARSTITAILAFRG